MTDFNFIFDTIQVPYTFRLNYDHDTSICDTPSHEDTPLRDTPNDSGVLIFANSQLHSVYQQAFLIPRLLSLFHSITKVLAQHFLLYTNQFISTIANARCC